MSEKMSQNTQGAVLFGPMRPPFLLLALACVLLGVATAKYSGATLVPLQVVLVFIGGLAAHISVNALNEYDDFRTGLDFRTEATPFSGGSKTLPNNPGKAHVALATGLVAMAVTTAIGIYFLTVRGWGLLPIGLLGLIVVAAYTPLITRDPILCLIAPGLGFGTIMVMGTHFALTGSYSWTAFIASLVPFFLVSDLLLLNQFPDVEADRSIGRKHVLVVLGRRQSIKIYTAFLVGAYLAVILGYLFDLLPLQSLLALLTILVAVSIVRGAARYYESIPQLIPYLGQNVLVNLATPVLLAVGLFWAA
jgi:1,4-dihydroxy-2-naphthoate octaprenyltransferase